MKTFRSVICWLFFLGMSIAVLPAYAENNIPVKQVTVEFFYQPGCAKCHRIKNLLLPELAETCKDKYHLESYSTSERNNYLRLLSYLEKLKVKAGENETAYMVIDAKIILAGKNIEEKLIDTVNAEFVKLEQGDVKADHDSDQAADSSVLMRQAEKFTVGAIIVAGLLDGINPCVFSTLVFFISLLTVAKVSRQKMLWVGIIYCSACFATYFALGFGLFEFIRSVEKFHWAKFIIDTSIIAVLVVFAVISFADAIRYRRSGRADAVMMKLPPRISDLIHRIMKHGLAYKTLLPGIFVISVLVTIFESVCTGQVYIPTLVLMTKDASGFKWVLLLLLYNLMFILPLVIIFIAVFKGVKTPRLLQWSKQNVFISKLGLGCFFLLLAAVMLLL